MRRMAGDMTDRRAWIAFGVALIVFVLLADQISKWWVLEIIRLHERLPIDITGFFRLNFHSNPGVSFGMLRADNQVHVWGLTLMQMIIAGAFFWWMRASERPWTAVACALVAGGALGNIVDRVRFGYVVDFLDFYGLGFPWVFNLADTAITLGATLLVLDFAFSAERKAGVEPAR
jgi:signal peptidase II